MIPTIAVVGVIFGSLMVSLGVSWYLAALASMIIFTGAAQMLMVTLLALGQPHLFIIYSAFCIDMRHFALTVSLHKNFKQFPFFSRFGLAFFLTDEVYSCAIVERERNKGSFSRSYYMGSALTEYSTWVISTLIGTMFSLSFIPGIDHIAIFVLTILFLALSMPLIKDFPKLIAFLTSGVISIFGTLLMPEGMGPSLGIISGVMAGAVVLSYQSSSQKQTKSAVKK